MGFKIIKEQQQQQRYCDYVQNKLDIAQQYGARYELTDEDIRVQKLYDDKTLRPVEKVRSISRVKKLEDGKECLVVSKEVAFVDKLTGIKKDSYIDCDGLTELPLKVTNEDGATETSQVKLEYDIPFSKSKVMEYVRKAGDRGVELRFYQGPETGNRVPNNIQLVGNMNYFTDASWEELLLGKEMGLVHSRINRLNEVRKSIPNQEQDDGLYVDPVEPVTQVETNKVEKSRTNIVEETIEQEEEQQQQLQQQEGTGFQEVIKNEVESKIPKQQTGIVKLKVSKSTTTTKQN